ncbi:MAG: PQQ-dependent sugar dehydrogenase [Blastocatellia bacterium]|nr:PQQ-dependent sugar dehydrogenase [Blastocatellia bacterium]
MSKWSLVSALGLCCVAFSLWMFPVIKPAVVTAQGSAPIRLEPVVSGLSSPVYVTHAGDNSGRLFAVERPGRIRLIQNGALLATAFLDITALVLSDSSERGLLSVAFHPQFAANRRFFVNYTRKPDGATVVAEYTASVVNPNLADTAERVVLTVAQPFNNHNGGQLQFGPDGYLYIGMGDGGSAGDPQGNGQNINTLLGKMLRLNVDGAQPYESPADNPFFGSIPGRDEIFAVGFRNPWRFSFDRQTGQLYVADVGQSNREEVDLVVNGGNYGWNTMEGTNCFNPPSGCNQNGLILPITEYGHTGGQCSITGGYVYRGTQNRDLQGMYIYGDYCRGNILGYRNGTVTTLLDQVGNIASFGQDQEGELYVVLLNGAIRRIVGPSIRQFYPFASTFGKTITVTGSGFLAGQTEILFGGNSRVPSGGVTVLNETTLQVVVPPAQAGVNLNGFLTVRVQGTADATSLGLPTELPSPGDGAVTFQDFILWGDASGDGQFATSDVALARAFIQFQAVPTTRQRLAVDVVPANANGSRGDGNLNAVDFSFLRAVSFGQTTF